MPEFEPIKKKGGRKKKQTVAQSLFPCKGDGVGEVIRKIVFLLAILTLIGATAVIIWFYFIRTDNLNKELEEIQSIRRPSSSDVISINMNITNDDGTTEQKEVTMLEEYAGYYEANPDTVGYVEIYPWVGFPVVQTTDNDFYLKHNFYQQVTENGTIFADYEVPITADSMPANTIIYGHNLLTRNMFEPLSYYRKGLTNQSGFEFFKDNYLVTFDTLYEKRQYLIFAVFLVNTTENWGEVFDYQNHVTFHSKREFDGFVSECLDRSYYYTGINLEYGDELLTLSTCDFSALSDMRLVVVARKLRDGESPILDTGTFIDNSGKDANGSFLRKMCDVYNQSYGNGKWAGRQWDTAWIKDFEG